jgi:23S rRNA pseudouridine2605 synthase
MERLQKFIANSGYTSRRKAEELISSGHVLVNGKLVTELGTKVEPKDKVVIDGQELTEKERKVYYLLNKPRNVICSVHDEFERSTVLDYVPKDERIYPIGRLDYDTTGLIILTNDGDFANLLMHPRNKIVKTYLAKIEGILDKDAIDKLKKGVMVDNKIVHIEDFKIKKKDFEKNISMVEIKIIEGRNHIVKNIFKELGYTVIKLSRISYGFLSLEGLQSGEYRKLTQKEVNKFYERN